LTGIVDLTDDDPHLVETVLNYLYCGRYAFDDALHSGLGLQRHHAAVYVLADKWDVAPLKELVSHRFLVDGREILDGAMFLDVVQEIYATTPENDELRMAAAILVKRFVEWDNLDTEDKERVKEIPGLGANLGMLYIGMARDPTIPEPCRCCKSPFDSGAELPLWATHICSVCDFPAKAQRSFV